MTLVLLSAVVSASASTLIPVTFLPNPPIEFPQVGGLPVIDAEYLRVSLHPHVVHLGSVGHSMVPEDGGRTFSGDIALRISTSNYGVTVTIYPTRHGIDSYRDFGYSTIGIGPGSDLLRVGGQRIDLVRQSTDGGFLRLGGSEDYFISNDCLSDSVMRMATAIVPSRSFFGGEVTHVETRVSVSIADNVITADTVTILDSEGYVLTMPNAWIANIYEELPRPLRRERFRTVFSDCANHLQRLPHITLQFSAGGLRLSPADYTRSTGQDDTCELLILNSFRSDQTIRFNPLMIPGINARSTENEIILCDSAINL